MKSEFLKIIGLSNAQQYALNVWLISFYFAGIGGSDVLKLKWKDFLDDRLHYRMGKNIKLVLLKIPNKVLNILNKLDRGTNSIYLFKALEDVNVADEKLIRTRKKTATRNFNRRLEIVAEKARIDKKIVCILLAIVLVIFREIKYPFKCFKNYIDILR